jgi:hydroxyacylglutathione hydrolase
MGFAIELLPAFADNYIYLVSDTHLGLAMVVDPGDGEVVLKALKQRDLFLALILNTHHHNDHIGGNARLQKEYGAPIIGPAKERHRIEGMTRAVTDGDIVSFSDLRGQVIATPGHTSGHIAFFFPDLQALFCGDTLFSLGCGRLFEGTSAELWNSLTRLRALPDDTKIYCGHEYTEANAKFALAIDKTNAALKDRLAQISELRRRGQPTIPALMGDERKLNPFLRLDDPSFKPVLTKNGLPTDGADPAALFGALRAAKDRFTV